ncbi:hypothetical protein FA314_15865, partial [Pseudomonas aeruginosa]|nr:hypothetical protein [Pseudomonas aeruginosa]
STLLASSAASDVYKRQQYNRSGELAGSADIAIDNFALGTVNDTTGAINPFLISNPYIEFAYDGSKMVGIRIGFGEAKGYLSGDIKTLTGNVPVDLYGTGSQLGGSISCGLLALDCLAAKTAITLTGSSQYTAQAELVNSSGNPDPIRAAMIGLKNGTALDMHDSTIIGSLVNVLLPFLTSNDCKLMGAQTCFNLAQYQSFPIGTVDPNNAQNFIDSSKGFFISMQSQNVQWRDQQDPSKLVAALAGAFLNMSRNADGTAPIKVDFGQAFNGIPRQDTCLGGLNKGC